MLSMTTLYVDRSESDSTKYVNFLILILCKFYRMMSDGRISVVYADVGVVSLMVFDPWLTC